ncbi:MAG TPA: amidophosphoribosyltransferase, partial [Planctomycetota bacterium]|nr:amidophosphoribosyltransferase [Planctomycetota bacterium]
MSDSIKHECGLAMVRLKKPLAHYRQKHGTALWGLNKLYLLMEKQRNRGQDGAGVGVLKMGMPSGARYYERHRECGPASLDRLWKQIHEDLDRLRRDHGDKLDDDQALKRAYPWLGEAMLGHLRYGTHGGNSIDVCHPYERPSNWPSRYLTVAGNFNLTNTSEIFDMLVGLGQHPIGSADTSTVMEKIGHFLDEANEALVRRLRGDAGDDLAKRIGDELDLGQVLKRAARTWDGGYLLCGLVGHGVSFALRDPNGIRPGFWYEDDEVVAVASERVALVTCFNAAPERVPEI